MSFNDEANKEGFQINVVLKIGSVFYSQYQVDSGLVVLPENIGLLSKPAMSATKVDARNVNTTIASLTFEFLDGDDGDFRASTAIMQDDTNFLQKTCVVFVGFITAAGFDFSDYREFTTTKITNVSKGVNTYKFKCSENTSLILKPSFNEFEILDGGIDDIQVTLDLLDASAIPNAGTINIGGEFITYTGKNVNQLTGLTRGSVASTADDHSDGDDVFLVEFREENPIDLMLDIMQTILGIAAAEIDIVSFTAIRDSSFALTEFRFWLFDIQNTMKLFEAEILQPLRCRIIMKGGKIALAILDEIDLTTTPKPVNENTIIGNPSWSLGSNKIINKIIVKWNYDDGQNRFSRTSEFTNDDSIAKFPNQKALKFQFKGVRADLNGAVIVQQMAARLLSRLSSPRASILMSSYLSNSDLDIGDDLSLTHRFIPQQGGSLGMSDQRLEIMSRSIDFTKGIVKHKIEFTAYEGLRLGLIAPSPEIVNVIDQKTFTVPNGAQYLAGYFLQLWNDGYLPDAPNEIESVTGNTIKMVNNFVTPLTILLQVKFPCYNETGSTQKGKYALIGKDAANFDDGTKAYQITF